MPFGEDPLRLARSITEGKDPVIASQLDPVKPAETPAIQVTPAIGNADKPLFFDEGGVVTPPFQGARSTTERQVTREESDFDMNAAAGRQGEAFDSSLKTLAEGRDAQKGALATQAAGMGAQAAGLQSDVAQSMQRQADLQKEIAKLDATKIEDSDFWRDAGSGRTVAAALALFGGGFVNAIRPGSNNVTETIYGAVDRYVQRKVLEKNEKLKRRADLLGDEKLAQRMLKVDIRKLILDQAVVQAQTGAIDNEYAKTLARMHYDNVKDLNTLAQQTAGKTSVMEKEVQKPASPIPWAQYGNTEKNWQRFTQGEDKKAGAVGLVSGIKELRTTRQFLDKLAAAEGGTLPNYGAFTQLLPEGVKEFGAKLGIDGAANMIEVRQAVDRKVLEVIRTMNSRLVDSDQERKHMQGLIEAGDTANVFRGLESMQSQLESELKDRATESQIPGVDPGDMIRYVAQQREALEPGPKTQRLRGAKPQNALEQQSAEQPTMDDINRVEPGRSAPTKQEALPERRPSGGDEVPMKRTSAMPMEIKDNVSEYVAGNEAAADIITRQILHETDDTRNLFGFNVGGHKADGKGRYFMSRTTEGEGANARQVKEPFQAYDTLDEGVAAHMTLLRRKYPKALDAAMRGDDEEFVQELKKAGYFTGNEGEYLNSMRRRNGG